MDKQCYTCRYNERRGGGMCLSDNWRSKTGKFVCTCPSSPLYENTTEYHSTCEYWESKL